MEVDTRVKDYIRMEFDTGGAGLSYNGIAYPAGEAGIKAFARAVWADGGYDNVVIIQNGFQGGYAQGQKHVDRADLLACIMQLINEFGFGSASSSQMMIFGDYTSGIART